MLVSNDPDVNLDLSQCQSRFILISIIIKILGLSVCQLIFGETQIFLCFCDHQFLTILTISIGEKSPKTVKVDEVLINEHISDICDGF